MIATVTSEQLAELARHAARQHPPRSRERRAAALWVALITTRTVATARQALTGFAAPQTQADADELLFRLAKVTNRGETR